MKKTVLIFGISSFVGSNLAQFMRDDFRVVGTYYQSVVDVPGISCMPCDVLKKDYVHKLVAILKPDVIIYAIGLSSLAEAKQRPKLADALNSVGASNVSRAAERFNAKFVYISSSFVLGGEDVTYKEGDIPLPNSAYGNSISSAEFYVQRSSINYLILRTCPLYGRSYSSDHPNWFELLQAGLAKNETIHADETIRCGFLDIAILARILKSCLEVNITNRLLQVSSANIMTRYEFARAYAQMAHKDENLIQAVANPFPIDDAKKAGKSAASKFIYRMDTTNIESALGTKMPKIEDSLQFTWKRLNQKFSAKNS